MLLSFSWSSPCSSCLCGENVPVSFLYARRGMISILAARSFSVNFGTIYNALPTIPKCATSKIGADGSLLMAMIRSDVCMPTRCWMAPEMPQAM
jgi:hypothetical protein